ncbi:MAG: hypothetical protein VXU46_04345, partial [Planctomycetota bacterium]|nr:hypothetical protein [Planctomycetota bacterium]
MVIFATGTRGAIIQTAVVSSVIIVPAFYSRGTKSKLSVVLVILGSMVLSYEFVIGVVAGGNSEAVQKFLRLDREDVLDTR